MDFFPDLKVRQKIMVARRGEKEWFFSTIQDIRDGELFIEQPRQRERVLVFHPGEEVEVRITGENASYVFFTRVLGRTRDQIPLYRLAPPETIQRVQQRRFVRFPVSLEVFYAFPPDEKKRRPRYLKGLSLDLSGGGVRLAVREPVEEGAVLQLRFTLPLKRGLKEIKTEGKVVRCWKSEKEGAAGYEIAVEFLDIGRTQQDYIVNFIFSRMAEQGRLFS
mgnify:CR=1 FL=1